MTIAEQTGQAAANAAVLAEFAREERARLALANVLPRLVDDDPAAISEDLVIRTRAMIAALAADLLRDDPETARVVALERSLISRPGLLAHCHCLVLEAGSAERLSASGFDPVLSPVFEALLAADAETAHLAMSALAAQSRFVTRHRRLETTAAELPAELMHEALVALADLAGDDLAVRWRAGFDEGRSRLSLLARLALAAGEQEQRLLDPAAAGLALFSTALAQRAGVARDEAILAGAPGQQLRLALLLRAAGVAPDAARAAVGLIHGDAPLPDNWDELTGARAAALLAGADA